MIWKAWCPHTFEPPYLWALPPFGLNPLTVAQFIAPSPQWDAGPWPSKRLELPGYWQMHRCYIYNKYFSRKLTTLSLYQKCFINNNIVSKMKCMYWFNYKIIGSQRTNECYLYLNFNQINSYCINYNAPKTKSKTNYA